MHLVMHDAEVVSESLLCVTQCSPWLAASAPCTPHVSPHMRVPCVLLGYDRTEYVTKAELDYKLKMLSISSGQGEMDCISHSK